jgi:4-amino-4-deoxy-L-arabinose transferase-like glycosyltransferase
VSQNRMSEDLSSALVDSDRIMHVMAWIVIVGSFWIRIWNIGLSGPSTIMGSDEYYIVHSAQSLFTEGNWYPRFQGPHNLAQPDLPEYVTYFIAYFIYKIGYLFGSFTTTSEFLAEYKVGSLGVLLAISRTISVMSGSLTVAVCYYLGRRIFNVRVGLIAAVITSLGWYSFFYSKIGMYDSHVTLFMLISCSYAHRILTRGLTKDYALAGLWGGLATACKYTGVFTAIPIGVAHLLAYKTRKQEIFSTKLGWVGLAAFLGFVLTVPYAVLDFQGLLASYDMLMGYQRGLTREYSWANLNQFWNNTLGQNFGEKFRFLFLGGIVLMSIRHRPKDLLILSLPLVFIISNSRTLVGFYERILQTIVPVGAIICGVLLDWLIQSGLGEVQKRRKWSAEFLDTTLICNLCVVVCLVVLAKPAFQHRIIYDQLIGRSSINEVMNAWVDQYLPSGAKILCDKGSINPSSEKFRVELADFAETNEDFYKQAITRFHYIAIGDFPPRPTLWHRLSQDALLVKEIRGSGYRQGLINQADHIRIFAPYRQTYHPTIDFVHEGGFAVRDSKGQYAWRLPSGFQTSAPIVVTPGKYAVTFKTALSPTSQIPVKCLIYLEMQEVGEFWVRSAKPETFVLNVTISDRPVRLIISPIATSEIENHVETIQQVTIDGKPVGEIWVYPDQRLHLENLEGFNNTLQNLIHGQNHILSVDPIKKGSLAVHQVPAVDLYHVQITLLSN